MKTVKIGPFYDRELQGWPVKFLQPARSHTTVRHRGYTEETYRERWQHVGVLRETLTNIVPEQPTNRYKQRLIDQQRFLDQRDGADIAIEQDPSIAAAWAVE